MSTEDRFEEVDRLIAAMDDRLRVIARRNAALAEQVEALRGFVADSDS